MPNQLNVESAPDQNVQPDSDAINSVDDLTAVLEGNTQQQAEQSGATEPEQPKQQEQQEQQKQEEKPQLNLNEPNKANQAFAAMRKQNTEMQTVLSNIAQALGMDTSDMTKVPQQLAEIATKRLAEKAQLPVEVYNELTSTKQRIAELERERNIGIVRGKLEALQTKYKLDNGQMTDFLTKLQADDIDLVANPDSDVEYHYYRMYQEAIVNDRIRLAVEEALRKDQSAAATSSTPTKQTGASDSDAKINSVAELTQLLEGNK